MSVGEREGTRYLELGKGDEAELVTRVLAAQVAEYGTGRETRTPERQKRAGADGV